MKIDSIDRINNFKGSIHPETIKKLESCAKNEARKYVYTLDKGIVADKKVLLKIKDSWKILLDKLKAKVKEMHAATTMYIIQLENPDSYSIFFANSSLNTGFYMPVFIEKDDIDGANPIPSEEFEHIVNNIDPKHLDKQILKAAVSELVADLRYNIKGSYETYYPAILKYQSEINNVSSEEAESNIKRISSAYEEFNSRMKIKNVEIQNEELLDRIFGADK